jgi:hypothetical protein
VGSSIILEYLPPSSSYESYETKCVGMKNFDGYEKNLYVERNTNLIWYDKNI